jgi:hypothetical protein
MNHEGAAVIAVLARGGKGKGKGKEGRFLCCQDQILIENTQDHAHSTTSHQLHPADTSSLHTIKTASHRQ